MKKYDHTHIETKWQQFWQKNKMYATPDSAPGPADAHAEAGKKENFYLLVEFPYPSGNLHVGHWYAFAVPDILARTLRMQGKNVMYPIGFDAFGLPAENAAIKNRLNPREWTYGNIAYMKKQIESMGTSFDWSREVVTCDSAYYKWTQWLFLQLYKKGLVYQKETAVNWCPNDKTVLANEQVVDGKCERCGAEVEQRQMLQWNIKITDYADRLIDDLEPLDWPREIKESQKNWIGRSEGAEIDFPLDLGKKYKYLYLHGYSSGADRPRNHWYRKHLEALGHEVIIPELPNTDQPVEEDQVAAALAATEWDENTIVVGHSLGSVVAMKALMKSGKKIAGLVLVAPAMPRSADREDKPFHSTFDFDYDFEKIKALTGYRMLLSDLLESHRAPYLRELAPKLDARLVETTAVKEHFTGDTEPDVLMWLRPTIRVFTTRPDTLFGATYLVLAPEHPWVTLALQHKGLLKNENEIERYIALSNKKSDMDRQTTKEKTGVQLEGVEAVNPATGEKIPLFIADYVLPQYGTGAIMAVPAHDERDREFAEKFGLPIRRVVEPKFVTASGESAVHAGEDYVKRNAVCVVVRNPKDGKYLCISWKAFKMNGLVTGGIEDGEDIVEAAKREVREETGYKNLRAVERPDFALHTLFYHRIKKENRWARFQYVFLELENEERDAVDEKESQQHDVVWKSREELPGFFTVIEAEFITNLIDNEDYAYTGEGIMVNSDGYDGMTTEEARKIITEKFGRPKKTYKLRDWIVSRQRYWGVPIPIVHCEKCGAVPVPDAQLPVELPEVEDYLPEGSGKSPLAKVPEFVNVVCPKCGSPAQRETDTLDTFVDSSWYFLRYTDPKNPSAFASKDKLSQWMPVDLYSGGAEHTTMHVLYSRFWHKALHDIGLVNEPEPYVRRMNRSLILGPDGQKMSKSRGNVIDPDQVVAALGADTVRMYLAFIGPYNEVANYPWNPDGVVGVRRFLERVVKAQAFVRNEDAAALSGPLHKALKKVGEDIAAMKFNTAISQLMILLNAIEKEKAIGKGQWDIFVRMLAPFAPHLAEELWHDLGNEASVHAQTWPAYDASLLIDEETVIAVQIDGKTRGDVKVPRDADKAAVEAAAREAVAPRLEGKTIARTIVVPGRLVNFVLEV